MSLEILSIPTDRSRLVTWLEQNLTGFQLGQLVAELSVVHVATVELTLQEICGSELNYVMESGLSVLSDAQISLLLTNPTSLLDLQEHAFVCGSLYWGQLASDGPAGRMATALKPSVLNGVFQLQSKTLTGGLGTTAPEIYFAEPGSIPEQSVDANVPRTLDVRATWRPKIYGVVLALVCTAALLFMMIRNSNDVQASGWGFDRAEALSVQMPAPEFFKHLSDAGNEWFKKRPTSPAELEQRLAEFSHGCQTLIDAPLPQLDAASREWLQTKCRSWKGAVDQNLSRLKETPEKFGEILKESDAIVTRLVHALRQGPTPSA